MARTIDKWSELKLYIVCQSIFFAMLELARLMSGEELLKNQLSRPFCGVLHG